jgi:hypothetical protein
MLHVLLLAIALCLGAIAVRPYIHPGQIVLAADGKYEHVAIVSPMFLYKGNQGVLLMGKRNGNLWFIGKGDDVDLSFKDPVLMARLPLEKLDETPQ